MKYVLMSDDFESVLCDLNDDGRVVAFDDYETAEEVANSSSGIFVVELNQARNLMDKFSDTVH